MSAFPPPQLKYKLAKVEIQEQRLSRIALWRSCFVTCCAVSLCLGATLPYGQIKQQSQIQISGEKLVSKDTIHTALEFSYPQLIWTVNGVSLTQEIESIPSIATARVNKQIIPPRLKISLQERTPVALAIFQDKVGFLDLHGQWIEQKFYANLDNHFALPELKALNYQPRYQKSWSKIYQLISLYPELKVNTVEWNQSSSLFLHSKIGKVFLGSDLSRLNEQFKIMLKLQNLSTHVDRSQIDYLDLSNPNLNLIQKY